jgi:hypothetical protein
MTRVRARPWTSIVKLLNSPKAIFGLVLITVGVLVPLVYTLWYVNIHWILVDQAVGFVPSHVQVEFTPNFEGHYDGGIRFQRKIPFEKLQCLLGEQNYLAESQCKDLPAALHFTWQLKSSGRVVKAGTSAKMAGAYADAFIEMKFLYFESERGQHYTLELDFTGNASELAVANPRLRVAVQSWDSFDMTMNFLVIIPFSVLCSQQCASSA